MKKGTFPVELTMVICGKRNNPRTKTAEFADERVAAVCLTIVSVRISPEIYVGFF